MLSNFTAGRLDSASTGDADLDAACAAAYEEQNSYATAMAEQYPTVSFVQNSELGSSCSSDGMYPAQSSGNCCDPNTHTVVEGEQKMTSRNCKYEIKFRP